MTNNEFAEMLSRFIAGSADAWEFDDYTSIRQHGKLERLRLELVALREVCPPLEPGHYCGPEGLIRMAEIAEEIRALDED